MIKIRGISFIQFIRKTWINWLINVNSVINAVMVELEDFVIEKY